MTLYRAKIPVWFCCIVTNSQGIISFFQKDIRKQQVITNYAVNP